MDLADTSSNLYKYITILGALLTYLSLYALANLVHSHDSRIREVSATFFSSAESNEEKQYWADYLVGQKKELMDMMRWLGSAIGTGISLSVIGGLLWYFKIQRFEDKRLRLEVQRLELEAADNHTSASANE